MFRRLRDARAASIMAVRGEHLAKVPGADISSRPLPDHVAVIGAAGGLGQGILRVCRAERIGFTAIVRSRPERVAEVPVGSRVAVVPSLADQDALTKAFLGSVAVLTALGLTPGSVDRSALLSSNTATAEAAMLAAGVDRIIMINTMLAMPPGEPASQAMRFFTKVPGTMGRGAREQQAVVGCAGQWCISVASLDPGSGRRQFQGQGRTACRLSGLEWRDELLAARLL